MVQVSSELASRQPSSDDAASLRKSNAAALQCSTSKEETVRMSCAVLYEGMQVQVWEDALVVMCR